MRSTTRKKLLWLFFTIVILFVIFYLVYNFFILKMESVADRQVSNYIKENLMMQITFGGLVSIGILLAAALIIDAIVSRSSGAV